MLDFLLNGVAVYFCWADVETLFLSSYLLGAICIAPLWVWAGLQDWRRHEVSGYVCLAITLLTALHAILFGGWHCFLIVVVCAYFTFRSKEVKLVGQADFVMFGHWLTIYRTVHGSGVWMFVAASLIFLVCLIVYIFIYKDRDGKRWHPGKMVPLLPPYAVAVVLTALIQWPLSYKLFWMGW